MFDIVRMMAVFNEMDILPYNLEWYHRMGIRTVVVDNGSSDGSFEYCQEAQAAGKIEHVERFVTDDFEWGAILGRLSDIALQRNSQWLMLTAPDEFFATANGDDLIGALKTDARAGYNLIKFYNMEFWMTPLDDLSDPNPLTRMRHYSGYDVDKFRCFPNIVGIDVVKYYGHRPHFPLDVDERPSPRLYVSRHYKLRNLAQARRKIERIRPSRKEPDIHTHYLLYEHPREAIVPPECLHRYSFDHRWNFESVYDGKRGKPRATRPPAT